MKTSLNDGELHFMVRNRLVYILQQWYLKDAAECWVDNLMNRPPHWNRSNLYQMYNLDMADLETFVLGQFK